MLLPEAGAMLKAALESFDSFSRSLESAPN
jgi:hypothetical protein